VSKWQTSLFWFCLLSDSWGLQTGNNAKNKFCSLPVRTWTIRSQFSCAPWMWITVSGINHYSMHLLLNHSGSIYLNTMSVRMYSMCIDKYLTNEQVETIKWKVLNEICRSELFERLYQTLLTFLQRWNSMCGATRLSSYLSYLPCDIRISKLVPSINLDIWERAGAYRVIVKTTLHQLNMASFILIYHDSINPTTSFHLTRESPGTSGGAAYRKGRERAGVRW
jgi:hypothetical protein